MAASILYTVGILLLLCIYIYIYQFLPKITQICIIKFDTYVIKDAVKILLELEKSKISTSNRFRYRVFFYFPPVDGVKMPETNA